MQEGHNILKTLSSTEYKEVLRIIRHCILATDLALFFPNKNSLNNLLREGTFSWNEPKHRYDSQS